MKTKKEKKRLWLIVVPLVLLMISILFISLNVKSEAKETPVRDISGIQINISENGPKEANRKTRILGDNNNNLDENNPFLYLRNDSSNSVYFQFDVMENGSTIYSSNLIEPGMMEKIDAYSMLEKGEHTLEYVITTYNLETKETCLSGVKQIKDIIIN